jgi:hypothetical protein
LDEVHESNEVNLLLEDCWDPEKLHTFQSSGGVLEQSNKHNPNVFIDCSLVSDWLDSLIDLSGLLLVVSHLLAIPVSVVIVGWG